MKISKNFSREEFKCSCCDFAAVDIELVQVLEIVRYHFGKPITINSACRCELHNTAVGGSFKSQHKNGMAADIVVKDTSPSEVYEFLNGYAPNKYGLGDYDNFTHLDVRENKARW